MTDTTDQSFDSPRTTESTQTGAFRGRRLSWDAFYRLRPDLKPAANDNDAERKEAA